MDAIFSGGHPPVALVEYHYREKFHLTHKEMLEEPWDVIRQNLFIAELLAKRDEIEQKLNRHG